MPTLRNKILEVEISTHGAELQRVFNKETRLDYLWNADPRFWAKHSPVLFPVVGELRNGSFTYNGKSYNLARHGFARDQTFAVSDHSDNSVTFSTRETPETLAVYPFPFNLSIQYTIDDRRLYAVYTVENTGSDEMYFSLGAHPAFRVPLTQQTSFEDYYLSFSQVENADRYPLSANGLLELQPVPFFHNTEHLPLKRNLFYEDALVFKNLQSNSITLKNNKDDHGLIFYLEEFPYLGIWNKRDADFLCLEPWCGIADQVDADGDITKKEGINKLGSNAIFERQWSIEMF